MVKIGNEIVNNFDEPYIIAELGANHNGNLDIAKKMIYQAKKAGCDCVKFQSWTKDSIFSEKVYKDNYFLGDDYRHRDDYTLEEIVKEFSLSEKQLYEAKMYCDEIGIDFASTPFSKKEVDFLVDILNVKFIKVASMDLNNYPFLEYIASKKRPIVLSTGLSTLDEIVKAVKTIEDKDNYQIILLHCVSLYPPKDKLVNLNNIDMLRDNFSYPVGFSDHTIGSSIPIASVAKGACMIEKHFTLDKNMFGWDHKISADFKELKDIVYSSKKVWKSLGNYERVVSNEEIEKRNAFRRSIVASRDIPKGKTIERDDIDFKRPGTGIAPEYIRFVAGRVAKHDIKYDEVIKLEDI